jgi:hypothetical protein
LALQLVIAANVRYHELRVVTSATLYVQQVLRLWNIDVQVKREFVKLLEAHGMTLPSWCSSTIELDFGDEPPDLEQDAKYSTTYNDKEHVFQIGQPLGQGAYGTVATFVSGTCSAMFTIPIREMVLTHSGVTMQYHSTGAEAFDVEESGSVRQDGEVASVHV